MPTFPPIPTWDGLHPLIIHFPIALLLVAPLFILAGALLGPARGRAYLVSALALMVLGTASVFIAVESGEAAGKLADRTPQVKAVLEHHEHLAEATEITFVALTIALAAIVGASMGFRRLQSRLVVTVLPLVLLLFYGYGALLLADTAHNGGRLVHELGVRAMVTPSPLPPAEAGDD